ncbi:MAG: hypothetical protein Kow00117_02510 [Phototrophicales bacterium]|nr:MAG: hypothetical protein CUN56_09430 [Phototrophicales bacterium]RMG72347.1 MAG: response regulator [Chloroflexota bacterium]
MAKPSILIVEDHPNMREALAGIINKHDMVALEAEDGLGAIRILRDVMPDAVILDVELPGGINGMDILQAMRKKKRFQDTPIILHTSQPAIANMPESNAADLVILKPADPYELIVMLKRLINARKGK